jgi:hypothetical protein
MPNAPSLSTAQFAECQADVELVRSQVTRSDERINVQPLATELPELDAILELRDVPPARKHVNFSPFSGIIT